MLFELFLVGGFAFWILLSLELAFLFYCVAWRRGGMALTSVLLVLLAVQFLGNVPVFSYIWNNPIQIVVWGVIYLCVSVIWGVAKWYLFVRDNRDRYMEMFNEWCERGNVNGNDMSLEQKAAWQAYFDDRAWNYYSGDYEYDRVEYRPDVSKHRGDIMTWMAFWPVSLLWTLLNDPVTKLFRHIYYTIASSLKSIRDSVWKGTEGHMLTKEEQELLHARQAEQRRLDREQQKQ